jgi:hypothetical protein
MNWATYRTQIRRSILKEITPINWTNDSLLDACGWALDTFCAHTAIATGVIYEAPEQMVALPDDVFGDLEVTGLVYVLTSPVLVIKPASLLTYEDTQSTVYSIWGSTLTFSTVPEANVALRYFTYYPHPTDF